MESNEFVDVMRGKETEELLDILNVQRDSYVPEAIKAVEIVLSERGVSYVKLTDEEIESVDEAKTSVAEAAYVTGDWTRVGEYVIDRVIISIVAYVVSLFLGLGAFVIMFVLYYFIMESTVGKTVGKMALGLRVVDVDGNKPDVRAIAIRTLCRLVPFEAWSFVLGGWENHELKFHWHDRFSKTYVVFEDGLERN